MSGISARGSFYPGVTVTRIAVAFMLVLSSWILGIQNLHAQTLTVLHTFTGGPSDGNTPDGGLARDAEGNLYGTTCYGGANGEGVVFKIDTTGAESLLYSFGAVPDGQCPSSGLLLVGSQLYGTTVFGGQYGYGAVFKLNVNGDETIVHSFAGYPSDGDMYNGVGVSYGALIRDSTGNLYGSTFAGGEFDAGTVFKIDSTGSETVLYSFSGYPTDGGGAAGGVVRDAAGNLYGTTLAGGTFGVGTVFKLSPAGKETLMYIFSGGLDGGGPWSGLVRDSKGNLYGTAYFGGIGGFDCGDGCGVVFELGPGTSNKLAVLHDFAGDPNDGADPFAGLTMDSSGNLYGITAEGGSLNTGVVFKLTAAHSENVLVSLSYQDGESATATLIIDSAGNLYGTAPYNSTGFGTVFEVVP
jgi:uncharacterized repeat protein (TIGR03803 family)